ncbi:MAG: DUF11 domain-containing protein, partial [Burkholderiales bacterium]|nr:DUF11 domain-containing protein [Burkholderiales bacterium]
QNTATCPTVAANLTGAAPYTLAAAGTAIAGGASHTYTVTVPYTLTAAMTGSVGSALCPSTNPTASPGGLNNATTVVPNSGATNSANACRNAPGNLVHSKVLGAGPTATATPNRYTQVYTLTVINTGGTTMSYALTDMPLFGAGTTIVGAACAASGTGAAACAASVTGTGPWTVANAGTSIDAGGVQTYTLTVTFDINPATVTVDSSDCSLTTGSTTNSGLLNRGTLTPTGLSGVDQDVCAPLPPVVTHTKVVTSGPTAVVGTPNRYTVSYTLTVSNNGGTAGTYQLLDTPLFGVGTTVVGASCTPTGTGAASCAGVTGVPAPAWTVAAAGTSIATGGTHTYAVTVTFDVAPGTVTVDGSDCSLTTGSTTNTGLLNRAGLSVNGGSTINVDACVPLPPNVSHTKVVTSGPTSTGTLNQYRITYRIDVNNTGGAASGYELIDTPLYGGGATLTSATCTAIGAGAAACPATLTGAGPWTIAPAATPIAVGGAHSYTIVATFTLAPLTVTTASMDCSLTTGSTTNTGLLNRATLTPSGGTATARDACAPMPPVYFIDVVKSSSATLQVGDTAFAINYRVQVTNTGPTTIPNVQVTDNLGITFAQGNPTVSVTVAPALSQPSVCTPGTSFNGLTDFRLLSGNDTMQPGESCVITFSVRVIYPSKASVPDRVLNTAYASGTSVGPNPGHGYTSVGVAVPPSSLVAEDASNNALLPPVCPRCDPQNPTPNDFPVLIDVPVTPTWMIALALMLVATGSLRRRRLNGRRD